MSEGNQKSNLKIQNAVRLVFVLSFSIFLFALHFEF